MTDENQFVVPPSFIALYVAPGRTKPAAARAEIAERYEFCEDLAQMLTERARTLHWELGVTEDDVLERVHRGLRADDTLPPSHARWVIRRLAELLEWPDPGPGGDEGG